MVSKIIRLSISKRLGTTFDAIINIMSTESGFNPNIEETVTHTEYSKFGTKETHIPNVRFEFEGELPVRLSTESRTYEVSATKEILTAERFFAHTVKRDAENNITSVIFENEQAAMFFDKITDSYRWQAVSYLKKATADELAISQMEQAGVPSAGVESITDRLKAGRLVREAATGIEHDTRDDMLLTTKDLVLETKGQFTEKVRDYLPSKQINLNNKEVNFPDNDWYSYLTEEVLEWIQDLQKNNVEVTVQQTRFETGRRPFVINNVLLGKVNASPEINFYLEQEAARIALYAAETLRMGVRPKLNIFNTAIFEETTEQGYLSSKLRHFINKSAIQSRNMILISHAANRVIDAIDDEDNEKEKITTHNKISTSRVRRIIHHETAHFVDPSVSVATSPQREGFAKSIEYGFCFNRAFEELRSGVDGFKRELTPRQIYDILTKDPKGLTTSEIYYVPATFYCWLYEKLGPDAFRTFYGRLTGGFYEPWKEGVQKLKQEMEFSKQKAQFKGNVLNCLDSLRRDHRWTWENSQQLMDDYIADVNRGLKPPAETISTIN